MSCTHPNAYIEKPCCIPTAPVECGCRGLSRLVCPDCDDPIELEETKLYEDVA
jgi:hypothetical protein